MLPDFGWTELLVISVVLIVVIGPKDLPKVLRGFGKTMTSVRRMAGDFRKQFDDALKEAELDDVRTFADDVRSLDPRRQIREALDPLAEAGKEIDADMKKAMGDSKLPELPKSAPQMGLDQSGEKARAAQSGRRKGATGDAAKPEPDGGEAEPAAAKPGKRTRAKAGAKSAATRTAGAKTAATKTTATKTGTSTPKAGDDAPPPTAKARSKTAGKTAAASQAGKKTASRGKSAKAATGASGGTTKTAKSRAGAQAGRTNGAGASAKGGAGAKTKSAAARGSKAGSKAASAGSGSTRSPRKPAKGKSSSTARRKTAKADAPVSGGDNG